MLIVITIDSLGAALAFIHDSRYRGGKNGLDNMRRLMRELGDPQDRLKCVHIAGTNGKGSVCAFTQAVLRCAGYRTGLYTSPYLQVFNERIRVDGVNIPDRDLIRITARVSRVVESLRGEGIYPTEFEIITAIGFLYFDESRVDIAVIEVGMGGRFDSTNVVTPLATAITSIGLDHTKALGSTIESIAFEKAGIAKPGVPMILYPDACEEVTRVVRRRCEEVGAPFRPLAYKDGDGTVLRCKDGVQVAYNVGLLGAHQWYNSATARALCAELRERGLDIPDARIDEGLLRAAWPGRLEFIRSRRADFPKVVILDGAHNPQGARALSEYLDALRMPITLVTGMLREKDYESFARIIAPHVRRVLTVTPDSPRGVSARTLAEVFGAARVYGEPVKACPTLAAALHLAKSTSVFPLGWCVVAGSLYLAGEARTLLDAPPCSLLDPPIDYL
ncbi:MAG: bifunctional folylpolyglutamate synthase/dihydrofolate synthase [Oscillospiraceae bacterium]|nr:bifunctional folylpolyglutamate synthase/dihydrofolate synthase [Oscillospiraceae bacterium]